MKAIQESIKVMVRIRPPSNTVVYRDKQNQNQMHCYDKSYILDHIFIAEDTNQDIFQKVGYDLVSNMLQGYNSTLFVYGHTGSGKTFTMNGSNNQQGLICKTLKLLLKMTQNPAKYEYFSLKMSYFEIYNEQVRDLLGLNKLTVRQHVQKGFYIEGLQEQPVESIDEFQKIYRKGMHNRKTDTTKMNSASSRSHAILTFYVETKQKINGSIVCPTSKLNFVDLAGAERLRQTEAIGDRKSEAVKINTSLSSLNRVINMLSNTKNKDMIGIPYRESVLTMILKDSLGGNSHTIIIGTIHNNIKNPSNINDMLATLEFLVRAKKIKNEKKVNQKLQGNQQRLLYRISQYQKQIESYKNQIEELKTKLHQANQSRQIYQQQIKKLKEQVLANQSQSFQFMETSVPFFENPFQNVNHFKEGLSIIDEQQKQSLKSLKNPNQSIFLQCTQHSQPQYMIQFSQEPEKTNKKSHRSHSQRLASQRLSNYHQKVDSPTKYQFQQQNLLKLITNNIQNLDFPQAQLNILQAQHKKIDYLQKQLKKKELYAEDLIIEFQNQKNRIIKKYQQINNITQRSTLSLLDKEIEMKMLRFQQKLEEADQQKQKIMQQNNIKLLRMQQRLNQILKENSNLGKRNQFLQYNYQKLLQSYKDLQARQIQMDKILEEQKNLILNEDTTAEIISTITLHKKQQETKEYIQKIQQLSKINEELNDNLLSLELELNQIKKEMKQKNREIEQLQEEVQASQQKLNQLEQQSVSLEEYFEIKKILQELKHQHQQQNKILENFKDSLKIDVNGEQITVTKLLNQYDLKSKRVYELQMIRTNQEMKQIQLLGNLQLQKCKYNQFSRLYNIRISEQGKKIIEKDLQIQQLRHITKRLQVQIEAKQKELQIQSQTLYTVKKNEAEMDRIFQNFYQIERQYNKVVYQNQDLKYKLQLFDKYQSQNIKLEEKNHVLVEDKQKLMKKYAATKDQLAKYLQIANKQLEYYEKILTDRTFIIKKLQQQNQELLKQLQKYKHNSRNERDQQFKKTIQESYNKQKRINQLQEKINYQIVQRQEAAKINTDFKIQIQELNEELFKTRCSLQQQRRLHLQETNQLRSRNINKNIQQSKQRVAVFLKKNGKNNTSAISIDQLW